MGSPIIVAIDEEGREARDHERFAREVRTREDGTFVILAFGSSASAWASNRSLAVVSKGMFLAAHEIEQAAGGRPRYDVALTPWEVLDLEPGESEPGKLRRACERRLEQFRGVAEATVWIRRAYGLLSRDPTGKDPYGLLHDPWGRWAAIVAEHAPSPPAAVEVEPPAPQVEATPAAPSTEEVVWQRFHEARAIAEPGQRLEALRGVAHELGTRMREDHTLVNLWARQVLAACRDQPGLLAQLVRPSELGLDLACGGGAVTEALLDEAVAEADFRRGRFVASLLEEHLKGEAVARAAHLYLRSAQMLALARPRTARSLLATLRDNEGIDHVRGLEDRVLEFRIRAGEEMHAWRRPVRFHLAAIELTGKWDGDLTKPATLESIGYLRKLATLSGPKSNLLRLLSQRVPGLVEAARPAKKVEAQAEPPLPPLDRSRPKPRPARRLRREPTLPPPGGETSPKIVSWIIAAMVIVVFMTRACS